MWLFGFCVLSTAVPLTDEMTRMLIRTAIAFREDGVRFAFLPKNDSFEGTLATEGRTATLGGLSGQEFTATIETELRRGTVSFILDYDRFDPPDGPADRLKPAPATATTQAGEGKKWYADYL